MMQVEEGDALKSILQDAIGVLVVVDKKREIYFIENVKFHIDEVRGLGSFMEIEAIDHDGNLGREKLLAQCRHYISELGIEDNDLMTHSYSDMLLS